MQRRKLMTEPAQSELCVNRSIMHNRNPHAFDFILQIVDEYSDFLSATASFRLANTSRSRFNARQKRPLQRLSFRVSEKKVHCLQYYPAAAHYIYIAFDVLPTHSILFEQCYQLRDCHKLQCLTIDFKIDFTDMHRAELRARISKYLPTHVFIGDIWSSPKLVLSFGTDTSEIVSIASLYECIGVKPGCLTLEARVIYCESEVRLVRRVLSSSSSMDPRREQVVPFYKMTLADRTGCLFLELWRDAAFRICDVVRAWHEQDAVVLIRVSRVTVLDNKRKAFPKACRIGGADDLIVEKIATSNSPFLVDPSVKLDSSLLIERFTAMTTRPPFEIHLSAIVSAVGDIRLTAQGREIRSFRLHDLEGNYVDCEALGRHARNPYLLVQNEVVIFGAIAQPYFDWKTLWINNYSHIIQITSGCSVPVGLNRIVFAEDL